MVDSEIFGAFNKHDVARLMSLFTEDLEFYHDTGGLSNHAEDAESFKKVFASTPDIRRDLEPGWLDRVCPFAICKPLSGSRNRRCAGSCDQAGHRTPRRHPSLAAVSA